VICFTDAASLDSLPSICFGTTARTCGIRRWPNANRSCARFFQLEASASYTAITSNAMERACCLGGDNDPEGIVAKRKFDPYTEKQVSWLKIRNTSYSQWEGHEELFDRERESDPDLSLWDECVRACPELAA
jgi:hypothetical protein